MTSAIFIVYQTLEQYSELHYIVVHFCVVPPEIPVPPVNTTVVDGDEAVFNCTVVGDPLPTISWYISGVDLSLSDMAPLFDQDGRIDDYFINTTAINATAVMSILTLNETVPFLAEDYVCVASNSLGSANSTATLTAYGKFSCS